MGWKTFKERFQLNEAIISVEGDVLNIGSYIAPNLMKISMKNGSLIKDVADYLSKEDFSILASASEQEILESLKAKDSFDKFISVFYVDENFNVCEKECENFGYPNVTHDGQLMHNNIFFLKKEDAETEALEKHQDALEYYEAEIKKLNKKIEDAKENLLAIQDNKNILNIKKTKRAV